MGTIDAYEAGRAGNDALVEALVAPGEGSFVDALLALADEAAGTGPAQSGQQVLTNALQAALARKIRTALARETDTSDAA